MLPAYLKLSIGSTISHISPGSTPRVPTLRAISVKAWEFIGRYGTKKRSFTVVHKNSVSSGNCWLCLALCPNLCHLGNDDWESAANSFSLNNLRLDGLLSVLIEAPATSLVFFPLRGRLGEAG